MLLEIPSVASHCEDSLTQQCALGRGGGREGVLSGLKLPAGTQTHSRDLLVSPEDLAF